MLDKVYMNLEKNEATLIFDDGMIRTLSTCGRVSIWRFYEWFMSDKYYELLSDEDYFKRKKACEADTEIIEISELERAA